MVHGTTGGSPPTSPASPARLCELLELTGRAMDVPAEQPGTILVRCAGVWSVLRVIEVDKCSAASVGWAIRVLQLMLADAPASAGEAEVTS